MNQHRKPCASCPFRRSVEPGTLGGSPPETFIGQAFACFWLPCHEQAEEVEPGRHRYTNDTPQCAGAAIYRANAHANIRNGDRILRLEADKDLVFASPAEFLAHHKGITLEAAEDLLAITTPIDHWEREMQDTKARVIQ